MRTIAVYGKEFQVVNKSRGVWQTEYRNAIATKAKTKPEAVKLLREYDKGKLLSACDSHDKTIQRDTYFREHTQEFTAIFGFAPPSDYLLYVVGCGLSLDVIALDRKLQTPDGISTNNYIAQKYGQCAVDMVKNMI
jgi:hypothetical protein